MNKFAVINANGEVVNIIVADSKEIAEQATGAHCEELPELEFGIGDFWDGTQFIKQPEIIDVEEVTPTPALEG